MRHWTLLCAAILSAASACGGRAADNSRGGAGGEGSLGDAGSVGGGAGSCTGSLESVAQMARFACPPTLCDAMAWAMASCSLWSSVQVATGQACTGLSAFKLDLTSGETETCIYADKRTPFGVGASGPMLDGALVGIRITADDPRFCAGTAGAISAGQPLPSDCSEPEPSKVCDRASVSSRGAAPTSDDAAAPAACPDAFSSSCAPCCPSLKPDCAGKLDGYPGYSCTPAPSNGAASYCSCGCSAGDWQCGC